MLLISPHCLINTKSIGSQQLPFLSSYSTKSNRWRFPAWRRRWRCRCRGPRPCPRLPLPSADARRGFSRFSRALGYARAFRGFRSRRARGRSAEEPWFVRPQRRPPGVMLSVLSAFSFFFSKIQLIRFFFFFCVLCWLCACVMCCLKRFKMGNLS